MHSLRSRTIHRFVHSLSVGWLFVSSASSRHSWHQLNLIKKICLMLAMWLSFVVIVVAGVPMDPRVSVCVPLWSLLTIWWYFPKRKSSYDSHSASWLWNSIEFNHFVLQICAPFECMSVWGFHSIARPLAHCYALMCADELIGIDWTTRFFLSSSFVVLVAATYCAGDTLLFSIMNDDSWHVYRMQFFTITIYYAIACDEIRKMIRRFGRDAHWGNYFFCQNSNIEAG